jgi:hypothetical protein
MTMRILAIPVFLLAVCLSARASEGVTNFGVVLLQPDFVLHERVPNANALADYILALEGASKDAVLATNLHPTTAGFIVVAVRLDQKSNVWLDFDLPLPPAVIFFLTFC